MHKEIFVKVVLLQFVFSAPNDRECLDISTRCPQIYSNSKALQNNVESVLALPVEPSTPKESASSSSQPPYEWTRPPVGKKSREFWQSSGQEILREHLLRQLNKNVAKNLIILVAAGMSIPTQMATRVYLGGEDKVLSFEKFPYVGLSKVRRRKLLL